MAQPTNQPTVVNTGNIVNIVGGVRVSVEGVLSQQDDHARAEVLEARRKAMQSAPGDMNQPTKLRMVSLRKLDEAIKQCAESGKPLPDEIRYLAGLQRVQYVFVYPDQKDIVLAGPAEGWKINELGNVVGNTSGHPVMQLDDLLVALRCADAARKGASMCRLIRPRSGCKTCERISKTSMARSVTIRKPRSAALKKRSARRTSAFTACRPAVGLPMCWWRPIIG